MLKYKSLKFHSIDRSTLVIQILALFLFLPAYSKASVFEQACSAKYDDNHIKIKFRFTFGDNRDGTGFRWPALYLKLEDHSEDKPFNVEIDKSDFNDSEYLIDKKKENLKIVLLNPYRIAYLYFELDGPRGVARYDKKHGKLIIKLKEKVKDKESIQEFEEHYSRKYNLDYECYNDKT